jgi:hypothetical protein
MRAAVVIVMLCGCGLTMTKGPDARQSPAERPRCTETMEAPKRDGIGAVIGLVAIVFGGVALEADNESVGAPLLIGGLATMVGAYASGGIGYYRVKKCKKAIADFDRRIQMQPVPMQPVPMQP